MGDCLATIDMGRKVGVAAVPFSVGGVGSLSNIMTSPGPRPTSVPSGILIHQAVWPQYTNVTRQTDTDRQTDNGPISQSEPFYKRPSKEGIDKQQKVK